MVPAHPQLTAHDPDSVAVHERTDAAMLPQGQTPTRQTEAKFNRLPDESEGQR
jgi:hypothetical protein